MRCAGRRARVLRQAASISLSRPHARLVQRESTGLGYYRPSIGLAPTSDIPMNVRSASSYEYLIFYLAKLARDQIHEILNALVLPTRVELVPTDERNLCHRVEL